MTELPSSPVHHQAILIDAVERSNHSKRGSDEEDKDEESKALKRVKPSKQAAKKTQEKVRTNSQHIDILSILPLSMPSRLLTLDPASVAREQIQSRTAIGTSTKGASEG